MSKDIEKYAEKKAAEAEVRGKILGAITAWQDVGLSEEDIIKRAVEKFNVTEDYVRTLIHTAA